MYPAHRLDLDVADLAFAIRACAWPTDANAIATRLEQWWSPDGLACLSVRSAFDLLLTAHAWPAGNELVFSAVNMPDMARIACAHALVPVPADLDPTTLVPSVMHIERSLTDRTRAIVIAQLFGARADLGPIADLARRRGLLLIEDAAQAFHDPRDTGALDADVSLFSFGSIKTASALGGALVRVRDAAVREKMRAIQATWPQQPIATYARKAMKYLALLGASPEVTYTMVTRACGLLGRDFDEVLQRTLRGFSGDELIAQIRKQPSAPLLAMLERRLTQFDRTRLDRRAARGARLVHALPEVIAHVGGHLDGHVHWVFPVRCADPDGLVDRLRHAGFHATRRGSNLAALDGAPDPTFARSMMRELVFLPAYPELPEQALRKMIQALMADATRAAPVPTPRHEVLR